MLSKPYRSMIILGFVAIIILQQFIKKSKISPSTRGLADDVTFLEQPQAIPSSLESALKQAKVLGPSVLFFGFLRCASVCNLASAYMRQELNGNDTRGVFITIDPENDDLEALQEHQTLFGLTTIRPSAEQLAEWSLYFGLSRQGEGSEMMHNADFFVLSQSYTYRALVREPHVKGKLAAAVQSVK